MRLTLVPLARPANDVVGTRGELKVEANSTAETVCNYARMKLKIVTQGLHLLSSSIRPPARTHIPTTRRSTFNRREHLFDDEMGERWGLLHDLVATGLGCARAPRNVAQLDANAH